ncbi:MAG: hypothetical protein MZV64_45255 [Ignavibacteriales bacterium]|nr:hypothetical protein [Ignavibacteriales bacterium]
MTVSVFSSAMMDTVKLATVFQFLDIVRINEIKELFMGYTTILDILGATIIGGIITSKSIKTK